jgi:putative endonuclease
MPANRLHHRYWVYILANTPNGTIYVGVTNSLQRRVREHKTGAVAGFTKQYGLKLLVYFEEFRDVRNAIRREKEIKGWTRARKIALFRETNPMWLDLASNW